MSEFWPDFFEEALDFFEDFWEQVTSKKIKEEKKTRQIKLYGAVVKVRPAYIFAERIDNLLKTIFGISIFISALVSSFWGLTGLGELLNLLIKSIFGRVIMAGIGFCYCLIGFWKGLQLKK